MQPKENRQPDTSHSRLIWLARNLTAALAASGVVLCCLFFHPGYRWVYYGPLREGFRTVLEHPRLTLEERYALRLGASYDFMRFLKASTPENAVILYPGRDAFCPKEKESPFKEETYNKIWATRFLYPRKLVIPSEQGESPWRDSVTHVAVIFGWGLDYLPYKLEQPIEHGVLPLHTKPANLK